MTYEGAKDGRHYWLTPPELMKKLNDEFHFTFDPCPYPLPEGFDGLVVDWGESNYVNPPFHGPTAWVRKAIEEYKKGKKVVFVFPIDKWIFFFLENGAEIRNLKDVKWCATEDGLPGKGTGRHIAAFILDPDKHPSIGKLCPSCGTPILDGQETVEYMEQSYHKYKPMCLEGLRYKLNDLLGDAFLVYQQIHALEELRNKPGGFTE